MTISEIGLLKLKPTASLDDPELVTKLKQIKTQLQEVTGHPFYYLQQEEDASFIYMLGQWESLEQHYKDVHSSTEWKETLPIMRKYFDFQWMAHFDFLLGDLQVDAPLLSLRRYLVEDGKRDEVEKRFGGDEKSISKTLTEGKLVSGWKVDQGRKQEELVLLASGKDALPEDIVERYFKADDLVEKVEVAHMRLISYI